MTSKQIWIGVDVSKGSFWAGVARADSRVQAWTELPAKSFEHSVAGMRAFLDWLGQQGIAEEEVGGVCLESTGRLSEH